MINAKGIVQNNESTNELLSELKNSEKQYKNLSYSSERELIGKYSRVICDGDGKPVIESIEEKKDKKSGKTRYKINFKYEVLEGYDDVKRLLVMHHIRRVFNLSKKYAQNTRDFDNMIAKGLYGLVIASDKFIPYSSYSTNKDSYPVENDGITPKYTKFITYATNWILKYLRQEFNDKKTVMIDNYSMSINATPRIRNSTDNNQTYENIIDKMISPDVEPDKDINDELSSSDASDICKNIYDYVVSDESNLSAMEKQIFVDTFYNHKQTKDIAEELNSNMTTVISKRKKVLGVVKEMLNSRMKIISMNDIFS